MIDANTIVVPLSVLGTVAATVWVLRNWFSTQFEKLNTKVEDTKNEIIKKLEYHEEHDDERFKEVYNRINITNDNVWLLKLGQAQAKQEQINRDTNDSQTNTK